MPKRKPGARTKHRKKPKRGLDWAALKERYIVENLDPQRDRPYTAAELAKDFQVSVHTVRGVMAKEDWRGELRSHQEKRSEEAIARTRTIYADQERELRDRQANIGRLWQAKSVVRIQKIENPETDLTFREALDLGRYGAELERKARGLPELADPTIHIEPEETEGYESPEVKIARMKKRDKAKRTFFERFGVKDDEAEKSGGDGA